MRALMVQVVCIQVVCIQVVCATGFRTDGCVTLHPLRAAALIAWVARNERRRQRVEISNEHGTTGRSLNASLTLSIIDAISCANENLAHCLCNRDVRKPFCLRMRACDRSHAVTPPLCTLMPAASPLKQAIGTEITLVRPGGRLHRPAKKYLFFIE